MNDIQIILLKLIILHGLTDQEEWLTFLALRQLSKYAYEFTKQFYRSTMKKLSKLTDDHRTARDKTNNYRSIEKKRYYILGNIKHGKLKLERYTYIIKNDKLNYEYYTIAYFYKGKLNGKYRVIINNDVRCIGYFNNGILLRSFCYEDNILISVVYKNIYYFIDSNIKINYNDVNKYKKSKIISEIQSFAIPYKNRLYIYVLDEQNNIDHIYVDKIINNHQYKDLMKYIIYKKKLH